MAFSTYAAVLSDLKDNLAAMAAGKEIRIQSYTNPATGETVTYKGIDQLRREIERMTALAAEEADSQSRSRWTPIKIRRAL